MGNRIEVAKSGRSKCVTCNEVILKGTPRLSEEYNDIGIPDLIHRFYHLKCAAAVHPEVVAAALAHVDDGVEFDRAEIEAKIAPAVARAAELRKQKYLAQQAEKDAKTKAVIVEADEQTTELLAQLDGNPEDPGTLAVVADQLQARGDIRGELIALQLAAPSSTAIALVGDDDEETDASERTRDAQRRSVRIAELIEKLSVQLDPQDKAVWGVGFIRRLELQHKNGTRLAPQAAIDQATGYPKNDAIVPYLQNAIESYKEMADHGGKLGIKVTFENHWGLAADPMNIRIMIDEVNHPYCEASPDFCNWEHEYHLFHGLKALAPYSHTNVHAKYWDRWGDQNDVQRGVRIMLAGGFKGTFALEYEAGPLDGIEGAKYLYKEVLAALTTPAPVV